MNVQNIVVGDKLACKPLYMVWFIKSIVSMFTAYHGLHHLFSTRHTLHYLMSLQIKYIHKCIYADYHRTEILGLWLFEKNSSVAQSLLNCDFPTAAREKPKID
jgi:hypothetical protein